MFNYGAVILAAGQGTRFKGKKHFFKIEGTPVWEHVYLKAKNVLKSNNIVVVGIDIPGGRTRSESVRIGLNSIDLNTDRVIILESARPLVTEDQIRKLLQEEHSSACFVMPLVNTVIKRNGEYLNREELYELLTPQSFDYKLLREAYNSDMYPDMTDETRVMFEHYSISPRFIEGGENLIKLTYQRDINYLLGLYGDMNKEVVL